jgi:hypothetical protein
MARMGNGPGGTQNLKQNTQGPGRHYTQVGTRTDPVGKW